MMKPMFRKVLAGVAVVGALASVVAGRERPSPAPAVVPPAARIETRIVPPADGIDLAKLQARAGEDATTDAFAPRNFSPIVAPQAQGPAQAEAPPLPFRYMGKMLDDGKLAVFLLDGNESVTVKAGDHVGPYRVDSVTEAEVRLTYMPLKTKQRLPL